MMKTTNLMGGGIFAGYTAPDLEQTFVAVEHGFASSTSDEAFFDSQDGVTNEDYTWGGSLNGEFE